MALWIKILFSVIVIIGVVLFLAILIGNNNWNKQKTKLLQCFENYEANNQPEKVSFDELGHLPQPVKKYFHFALKEGQPVIRSVKIDHPGKFNLGKDKVKWLPFEADYRAFGEPKGFVWDASIKIAPLLNVRVMDSDAFGKGSMIGKVAGLIPVVNPQESGELNKAALERYLAEAVWFPTALLPSEKLTWSKIDSCKALATLSDSGITVSLEFQFNDKGEITGVYTERYREIHGAYELTPWFGKHWDYREKDGMMIPMKGEVAWIIDGTEKPYWRGNIKEIEYEFVK